MSVQSASRHGSRASASAASWSLQSSGCCTTSDADVQLKKSTNFYPKLNLDIESPELGFRLNVWIRVQCEKEFNTYIRFNLACWGMPVCTLVSIPLNSTLRRTCGSNTWIFSPPALHASGTLSHAPTAVSGTPGDMYRIEANLMWSLVHLEGVRWGDVIWERSKMCRIEMLSWINALSWFILIALYAYGNFMISSKGVKDYENQVGTKQLIRIYVTKDSFLN